MTSPKPIKTLFENIRSLGGAILLALAVRILVVEPFNIPSGSMIPSLLVGDYLFVSRYLYGYSRFSVPFGYAIPYFDGRVAQWRKPERGEVIVFRLPTNTKVDYIKRVIGLPGDQVQLKGGIVHINGEPVKLEKRGEYHKRADENGTIVDAQLYEETLPGDVKHLIIHQQPLGRGALDNTPVYTVPEGHYFVMGDNRNGSLDSRVLHEVGYIPEDYLIGRAEVLFFSTDGRARWWEIWKWPTATRWGRFPQLID